MATVVDPRLGLLFFGAHCGGPKTPPSFVLPPLPTSLSAGGCLYGSPRVLANRLVNCCAARRGWWRTATMGTRSTIVVSMERNENENPVNHLSVLPPVAALLNPFLLVLTGSFATHPTTTAASITSPASGRPEPPPYQFHFCSWPRS